MKAPPTLEVSPSGRPGDSAKVTRGKVDCSGQRGALYIGAAMVSIELPGPEAEVLRGIRWGSLDAFPTPAYWAFQVMGRRMQAQRINYKLGATLAEEVAACLLGGHGIPAEVGLAAFQRVRDRGAFGMTPPTQDELLSWLSEPLLIGERLVRYRFASQKSKYLANALLTLTKECPPLNTGRQLRDWLLSLPGIGPKTASWIARNWLNADDVAILDIHILRAGVLAGFFPETLKVERDYLQLEERFIAFSTALGVLPSELDAVIWAEMMASSSTVFSLFEQVGVTPTGAIAKRSGGRAKHRHTNANQSSLLV